MMMSAYFSLSIQTAMATLTTLERLYGAFHGELERQHAEGLHLKPGSGEGCQHEVAVIDGEIAIAPVVIAMLAELRKLPAKTMVQEIDAILAQKERGILTKGRRLSANERKVLATLAEMPDNRAGVIADILLAKTNLDEDAFIEVVGTLESDEYLGIEHPTGKVMLYPQGTRAIAAE